MKNLIENIIARIIYIFLGMAWLIIPVVGIIVANAIFNVF